MIDCEAIHITDHAIMRYRERTGCRADVADVMQRVRKALRTAVRVRRKNNVSALLRHEFKKTTYLRAPSGLIMVIVEGTLAAVYQGERGMFQPMPQATLSAKRDWA